MCKVSILDNHLEKILKRKRWYILLLLRTERERKKTLNYQYLFKIQVILFTNSMRLISRKVYFAYC